VPEHRRRPDPRHGGEHRRVGAVVENSGAPHPSTVTSSTATCVSRSTTSRTRRCSGWSTSRYVAVSQPFATHVASIAACLPEQFCVTGDAAPPATRHS